MIKVNEERPYSSLNMGREYLVFRTNDEDLRRWSFCGKTIMKRDKPQPIACVLLFTYEIKNGEYHLIHHLLSTEEMQGYSLITPVQLSYLSDISEIKYLLIKTGDGELDYALYSFKFLPKVLTIKLESLKQPPQGPIKLDYRPNLDRPNLTP